MNTLGIIILKMFATACLFINAISSANFNIRPPFWQEMILFLLPNIIILIAIWM
jgi:hypothetical protein